MSWPLVKFKDIANVVTGSTPKKNTEYFDGEVPFVTPGDLGVVSEVTTTARTLTREGAATVRCIPAGSVMVCCIGATIGKVGYTNQKVASNQQINSLVVDTSKADPKYVYYYCLTLKPKLISASSSTTMPIVNKSTFAEFEIPLPPLAEQKRIAAILDKADAIRQKRKQAIDLADEFLRSVFLDMFGDPVSNPKGWETKRMGDVIEFKGGHQPPKSTFKYEPEQGYVRLIQIRDFKTDKYKTYIPEDKARRIFDVDDVMIARYGPPVFQILKGLSGSYNVALMKASPKNDSFLKSFIFYLLQLPAYHDVIVANSERTAGQTGVNLELLNNFTVPVPSLSQQQDIMAHMVRLETIIDKFNVQLTDAEELFSSLSQKAFSGEL
ncbi:restriction endonuclease subunit S [Vibrio splendidus]|uniref:restriction endonuclease subunit S n=1 Tax=Vibrio splendidus TaxID=29497 RepID=UPI0007F9715B|nr:restriction endonuclease subunit S [Vibrio splendidus]OBT31675.1 hypothetical protein A9262_05755 [Vibrio splendidus]